MSRADPVPFEPHDRPLRSIVEFAAGALVVSYIVLFFAPFELLYRPPGIVSTVLYPAAGVAVLALTTSKRLGRVPISFALAGLVVWLMLSWSWTENPAVTTFEIRAQLPSLVILTLVVGTIPPERLVRTLIGTIAVIAVWSTVASIVLPIAWAAVPDPGGSSDAEPQVGLRGTFGHKNQLGIFMNISLCAIVAFVRRGALRTWLVVLCVALVIGSRSATAASGLLAVTFAWFWIAAIGAQRTARERTMLGLISVSTAVLAILVVIGVLPALLALYEKDLTFSGRTFIWTESLASVADRPIEGYGLGGVWTDGNLPTTASLWQRIGFPAADAHNGPLELALQAGVVGVGLFVALLAGMLSKATACFGRPVDRPYGQWGLMTAGTLMLMSISEPLLSGPYLALLSVIWTVTTLVHNRARREGRSKRSAATDDEAAAPSMRLRLTAHREAR